MFRRPRFIPVRRTIIPGVLQKLRAAQELCTAGKFEKAAEIFELLAHQAQACGIPRDAFLFLRASHCRLEARQIDFVMVDIKQALTILKLRGKPINLVKAGERIISDLTRKGFIHEAGEIKSFIAPALLEVENNVTTLKELNLKKFDTESWKVKECGLCGGVLHLEDVAWSDNQHPECPYCGEEVKIKNP